jgi:hypothetical protein
MVPQFNLFACKAIVSSGESKESHGSKSCEYKVCCRISVTLLLARNSHTKQSGSVECHGGKIIPWIPLFRSNSPHGNPADTIRYRCSTVSLQSVLVEVIHNAELYVTGSNDHTQSKLVLPFCKWRQEALPLRWLVLGFWVMPTHPHLINCYYLQRGFGV